MSTSPPPHTPLTHLARRLGEGSAVVAGVLSGTSVDGIDVALVRFDPVEPGQPLRRPRVLAFEVAPFPEPLGKRVRSFVGAGPGVGRGPAETAYLHRDLGLAFGAAARRLAVEFDLPLDLVGSHGQTVWHHDGLDARGPMSLQLGDGDHVASAAGAPAVSDFRTADIAAGGEGAPLTALVDGVLYADLPRPAAVLNLGGIANLTLLGAPRSGPDVGPVAFDVGPAGALLDGLARARLGRDFDLGGGVAAGGRVDDELLGELLRHEFLGEDPPKTTGRDTFGAAYLAAVLGWGRALSTPDLLATASAFVARAVLAALERWGPDRSDGGPLCRLVVAGGGVHHRPLMEALGRGFRGEVMPSGAEGVDPEAREAIAFALLAARFVCGEPSTHGTATGARGGHILGKLSPWCDFHFP